MPAYTSTTRPLDALAAGIVVVLCLSWGFNQVATKLAIHDIPPLMQAAIRSFVAAFLIAAWCRLRGIPLFDRDGTLWYGLAAGALFAIEFILIYQGLLYTTATRAVLFIYLAPFFVVLGARIVLPADRFGAAQWLGLGMSFAGMLIAFGVPTPALDPRQHVGDSMMVGGALFWAATTLTIKASPLTRASAEKVMLYQLVVSGPIMAIAAFVVGDRMTAMPSPLAIGSMVYQTVWVVSVTFV
ncbi:MAG: DMT family transporter, partial [Pseudolabrys sp.]